MRISFAIATMVAAILTSHNVSAVKINTENEVFAENESQVESQVDPLATTLARAANPKFNESGMSGSTVGALLAGYEPLKTIPGCMSGFARARACDSDGKMMTLD